MLGDSLLINDNVWQVTSNNLSVEFRTSFIGGELFDELVGTASKNIELFKLLYLKSPR